MAIVARTSPFQCYFQTTLLTRCDCAVVKRPATVALHDALHTHISRSVTRAFLLQRFTQDGTRRRDNKEPGNALVFVPSAARAWGRRLKPCQMPTALAAGNEGR